MVRIFLFALAALLVSTVAIEAQQPQQKESTYNYLVLARQAASQGYPGRAKELVDRAGNVARSAQDWYDISSAYDELGYSENAREATRKAQGALKR
jgi:hypothetical protein